MVSSLHYCRRLEPVVRLKPNWRFGVDGHGGIINGLSLEKKRRNPKKKGKLFSPGDNSLLKDTLFPETFCV